MVELEIDICIDNGREFQIFGPKYKTENCLRFVKGFEPRSHFKSGLSLIIWVNVVLNRTDVVDSDQRFEIGRASCRERV